MTNPPAKAETTLVDLIIGKTISQELSPVRIVPYWNRYHKNLYSLESDTAEPILQELLPIRTDTTRIVSCQNCFPSELIPHESVTISTDTIRNITDDDRITLQRYVSKTTIILFV